MNILSTRVIIYSRFFFFETRYVETAKFTKH